MQIYDILVHMSGINPYASLFLQSLYAQGQSNPFSVQAVDLLNLPPDLRNLTEAKTIQGQVTAQSTNGKVTIETPQGQQIEVRLKTQLPVGTKIDLQIPSGKFANEGILQPTLTRAINNTQQGQANTVQSQQQSLQTKPTEIIADVKNLQVTAQKATLSGASSQIILKVGQSVRLSPLPPSQQNIVSVRNTPQHPQIQSNMTSSSLSNVGVNQPTVSNAATTPPRFDTATLATQSSPRVGALNAQLTPSLSLGEKITLPTQTSALPIVVKQNTGHQGNLVNKDARVFDLTPPRVNIGSATIQPQATATSQGFASQTIAHATGHVTPQGNPIVQFASSTGAPVFYEMHYPAQNLPAGTQITLDTLSVKNGVTVSASTTNWKTMQDVMEFLTTQLSVPQAQSLMQTVPNAADAKSFPAAALLFLAAAKGGDLSGWFGAPAMAALQNAPMNIKKSFEKMTTDILKGTTKGTAKGDNSLPTPAQVSQDWRVHMLPMMFGADIHKLPLWVHDQYGEDDNGEIKKLATRFVIDLSLSRMGNVQVDGIIRNHVHQFDMAILTESDFGQDARDYITNIWQMTLQSMDMRGQIDFRRIEKA